MGGTAYETESERLRREGGEEIQAKMQIVLDESEKLYELYYNDIRKTF